MTSAPHPPPSPTPRRPSFFRRRPSSLKSFGSRRRIPKGVDTKIHPARLFLYFSLFTLPYGLSIVVLVAANVYAVPAIGDAAAFFASFEWTFSLWRYCFRMIDDGSQADSSAWAEVNYPTTTTCRTYSDLCASPNIHFWTKTDSSPGIPDTNVFCGAQWKTAVSLSLASAIAGAFAILFLVDNVLVWWNKSLWYHPGRHTSPKIRTVRRFFKALILISVALHFGLQMVSVFLIYDIQNNDKIRKPLAIQFHWGMWLGIVSWGADLLFLGLFCFFDRRLFFAVPVDADGQVITGRTADAYMETQAV
ncbi:hypothetical protein HDU85_004429 [Gaertneriomyces sp. JEL0708]|nr:hypothetical protein HDU85_004429 [Gaertneriomyces sp. JEL0708]